MLVGPGSAQCDVFYDPSKMQRQACAVMGGFQGLIANPSQVLLLPGLKGVCKHRNCLSFSRY